MDASPHTELPAFLDFCKSLDAANVHTPEQAVQLYRILPSAKCSIAARANLAGDIAQLRQQIVASGARLLTEKELDREKAVRRGEMPSAESASPRQ